jgi:hypothetical protein
MTDQDVIKWVVLTIMGIAVWFLKNTITKLQTDVDMIKEKYLHKDDFKEFKTELRSMFDELRTDIRAQRNEKN